MPARKSGRRSRTVRNARPDDHQDRLAE
jgi:hypothetical protein